MRLKHVEFHAEARVLPVGIDLVPGDAWVPDDHMKKGKVVVDLATRKVATQ